MKQLGDPEKIVLPLRELVSGCLGLWVSSVIDKKASSLLGGFDASVEGFGRILTQGNQLATKDPPQDASTIV